MTDSGATQTQKQETWWTKVIKNSCNFSLTDLIIALLAIVSIIFSSFNFYYYTNLNNDLDNDRIINANQAYNRDGFQEKTIQSLLNFTKEDIQAALKKKMNILSDKGLQDWAKFRDSPENIVISNITKYHAECLSRLGEVFDLLSHYNKGIIDRFMTTHETDFKRLFDSTPAGYLEVCEKILDQTDPNKPRIGDSIRYIRDWLQQK